MPRTPQVIMRMRGTFRSRACAKDWLAGASFKATTTLTLAGPDTDNKLHRSCCHLFTGFLNRICGVEAPDFEIDQDQSKPKGSFDRLVHFEKPVEVRGANGLRRVQPASRVRLVKLGSGREQPLKEESIGHRFSSLLPESSGLTYYACRPTHKENRTTHSRQAAERQTLG